MSRFTFAAESAGLVPHGDWIIGYSGGVLRGEGDFYEAVERSIDRPRKFRLSRFSA